MKYTKEEARVKKQALTSLQVRAIPPVVKTTGISPTMSMKNIDTVGKFSSIVGAASGFLVGIYIPIGVLPTFAQNLVKLTPGAYVAAIYRQLLMHDILKNVQPNILHNLQKTLGIGINLNGNLTTKLQNFAIVTGVTVILLIIILITNKHDQNKSVSTE